MTKKLNPEVPMGVSNWWSYGVKFGYIDYFQKQCRLEGEREANHCKECGGHDIVCAQGVEEQKKQCRREGARMLVEKTEWPKFAHVQKGAQDIEQYESNMGYNSGIQACQEAQAKALKSFEEGEKV